MFEVIGPTVLKIMNCCLETAIVPDDMKQADDPLLKKLNLDPTVLNNFRPVSNLSFMSKILEKIVFTNYRAFCLITILLKCSSRVLGKKHSTETALVKVLNDILLTLDAAKSAVLVLLDLKAAFDTIDHSVLISRLEHWVGIQGNVLKWFQSYFNNRRFSVSAGEFTSDAAPLTCGVLQGSILAPILFSLYMLPLGLIFRKHGVSFHCYADDTQIYRPLESNNKGLNALQVCLADVKAWMSLNFLHLNEGKTEIIVFESSDA